MALLTFVLVTSACGGALQSSGPSASGVPSSSASNDAGAALDQELRDAIADPSLKRLAEVGEALDAAIDEQTGLVALVGPELVGWLTDQRSAALTAVLGGAGIVTAAIGSRRLSTDEIAVVDPGAVAFGEAWLGTSLTMPLLIESGIGGIGEGTGQLPSEPQTFTEERTEGGLRVKTTTTVALKLQLSGDLVIADADVTQDSTAFDATSGAVRGSATHRSHVHAEVKVCPSIDGEVVLKLTIDMTSGTSGIPGRSGGSFEAHATDELRGQVGDDAFLSATTETSAMEFTTTSADGTRQTGSGSRSITESRGVGGVGGQITDASATIGDGSMPASESQRWQNFLHMTSVMVTRQAFAKAQAKWRSGACVRIESTEQSRFVDPDELVHFTAKPFHKIDGTELDKPVVATFAGEKSAVPLGQAQDPPADVSYTAPTEAGRKGTVTLTSTSNRGIGTLDVTFTVAALVIELEILSSIKVTKITGYSANGLAKAEGRIRLEKVDTDEWHGEGLLDSTTTSPPGGCNYVTVTGQGAYDWVVRNAVISPTTAAEDIVVHMDAGTITEQPDTFVLPLCRSTTLRGTLNTWENLFFTVHRADYRANGFEVGDWSLVATDQTWKTGGLIAEAKWSGTCAIDDATSAIVGCSETTTFRLHAVIPPPTP